MSSDTLTLKKLNEAHKKLMLGIVAKAGDSTRRRGWEPVFSKPSNSDPLGQRTVWVPKWETVSRRRYYGPFTVTYQRKLKKWIVFMRDVASPPLIKVGQVGMCATLEEAKTLAEATYTLGQDHGD